MGKRDFERLHHVAFFDAMATELPDEYASQEVNHLTLAYFAVGGLSLLRELDRVRSHPRPLRRDASFVDPLEFCRPVVMFWIRRSAKSGS
jgi:geranylgeranyl transferase type-1 subunit beta